MIDGPALGKTTPGPLIMGVAFVGFVGGWARQVLGPQGWAGRFDAVSAVIAVAAAVALMRFKVGVLPLLGACAGVGLANSWLLPRFS